MSKVPCNFSAHELLVAELPLDPSLIFDDRRRLKHLDDEPVFGTLSRVDGSDSAYLREHYSGNFTEGLHALYELPRFGIKIPRVLPFVAKTNGEIQEMLLVEYIDGPDYNESGATEEEFLKLARTVGNYILTQISERKPYLVDIEDPFQYVLGKDGPILVDLDLHLIGPRRSDQHAEPINAQAIESILEGYQRYLSQGKLTILENELNEIHQQHT